MERLSKEGKRNQGRYIIFKLALLAKRFFMKIIERITVEVLVNKALNFHKEFDKKWRENYPYSFHNQYHIKACINSIKKLFEAALKGEDPLRIRENLDKWNQEHKSNISLKDFILILILAFAFHDLGNIAEVRDGEITFLDGYKSEGAEERSKEIALKLMEEKKIKREWQELILHLIEETKFNITEERPFSILVRVIDQIGGNLFNEDRTRVLGLILELVKEKGKFTFNPHKFFNFVRIRIGELITQQEIRKSVLEIWGKELPKPIDLPQEDITLTPEDVEKFIEYMKDKIPSLN
jgi:hypothetical protein